MEDFVGPTVLAPCTHVRYDECKRFGLWSSCERLNMVSVNQRRCSQENPVAAVIEVIIVAPVMSRKWYTYVRLRRRVGRPTSNATWIIESESYGKTNHEDDSPNLIPNEWICGQNRVSRPNKSRPAPSTGPGMIHDRYLSLIESSEVLR